MRFLKIFLIVLGAILLLVILQLSFIFFRSSNSILKVETPNLKSKVYLDGRLIGTTPFLKRGLVVGNHTLKLEAEITKMDNKKVTFSKQINLSAQNITAVNYDFGPTKDSSAGDVRSFQAGSGLSISTTPSKSSIWLDGELIGEGSASLNPSRGIHKLRIGKSGFYTRELEINVESDLRLIVEVFLAENPFDQISKLQDGIVTSYDLTIPADRSSLINNPSEWASGVFFYATTKQLEFDALIDQNGKIYYQNKKSEEEIKAAKASTIGFLKATGQETSASAKNSFDIIAKIYQTAAAAAAPSVEILQTPTGILNVRNGPGTGYATIGQVNPGEKYELLGEQTGWYQIKTSAGNGWISSQYAKKL